MDNIEIAQRLTAIEVGQQHIKDGQEAVRLLLTDHISKDLLRDACVAKLQESTKLYRRATWLAVAVIITAVLRSVIPV